ncbi:MAG: hypothetical protein Ct9H90mP27_4160 [Gammaproteobacteria bacterium]|nr:MAG: hypothetical protein Ct9H90mP27_4160 [Gammaproteobacteria bacterium]
MPYKADEPSVSWISDSADLKAVVRDFDSVVGIDRNLSGLTPFILSQRFIRLPR